MSPRRDMTFGAQAGLRAPTSSMDGSREQRAALDAHLRRVRTLEATSTYQEMRASADQAVAGGTYEVRKWGDYNAATGRKAPA